MTEAYLASMGFTYSSTKSMEN